MIALAAKPIGDVTARIRKSLGRDAFPARPGPLLIRYPRGFADIESITSGHTETLAHTEGAVIASWPSTVGTTLLMAAVGRSHPGANLRNGVTVDFCGYSHAISISGPASWRVTIGQGRTNRALREAPVVRLHLTALTTFF